jgi:hypothetical protein
MDEYIKRDAASKAVYQYLLEQTVSKYPTTELCNAARGGASGAMEVLDDVPAADVAPVVHGEWIKTKDKNKKRCSRCDVIHLIAQYPNGNANYCPNCGAKMDGGTP